MNLDFYVIIYIGIHTFLLDSQNQIEVKCVHRNNLQPYLFVNSNEPIPYGSSFNGRYYTLKNVLMNENPVYRHEYYELYAMLYKNKLCFSSSLDFDKEGWNIEVDFDGLIKVWNAEEQNFIPEQRLNIAFFDVVPDLLLQTDSEYIPCKLQMSSDGELGKQFPEKMGVYKLIDDYLVFGKPIWKHISKKLYIRVDSSATWIVTRVSLHIFRCLLR